MLTGGRTALVTGASGGIGLELARLLADDGYRLVLVARSREELAAVATECAERSSPSVTVIVKDLARPAAVDELLAELEAAALRVDILVNNAGYAIYGRFTETDLDDELRMMQLNMVTLTHLTKRLLPGMIARGHGHILNLASMAAFAPGPMMSVYYASKAYVLSVSEALAEELRGTGVSVTALCPGLTATGFEARAGLPSALPVHSLGLLNPATVARAGYRGMLKGKRIVVPSWRDRILLMGLRVLPRALVPVILRHLQVPLGRR